MIEFLFIINVIGIRLTANRALLYKDFISCASCVFRFFFIFYECAICPINITTIRQCTFACMCIFAILIYRSIICRICMRCFNRNYCFFNIAYISCSCSWNCRLPFIRSSIMTFRICIYKLITIKLWLNNGFASLVVVVSNKIAVYICKRNTVLLTVFKILLCNIIIIDNFFNFCCALTYTNSNVLNISCGFTVILVKISVRVKII